MLENGVSYSRFYLATLQVDSYYWASYSSRTNPISLGYWLHKISVFVSVSYLNQKMGPCCKTMLQTLSNTDRINADTLGTIE